MTAILAIDPGETCGVAVFVDGTCRWTGEKTPEELYDWWAVGAALWAGVMLKWDVVVCEAFRLYPGAAAAQTWSSFATIEVIGVLRERCRREGIPFILQGAAVKKPTRAILKAHGEALSGKGPHAMDAALHGAHYVLAQAGKGEGKP